MEANDLDVQKVFLNDEQFRIPVFQRYYEWGISNWAKFMDDIISLYESGTDKTTHFIGPFVFISHTRPGDSSHHLIIDGQQRLITLSLIFVALRKLAIERELAPLSDNINKLLTYKDDDGSEFIKVVPSPSDEYIFRALVKNQTVDHRTTGRNIQKAFDYFLKRIEDYVNDSENQNEVLKDIFHTVKGLMLVQIILHVTDNPSNIYESLNFTGKKLDDSDLIKNFFFMQIDFNEHAEFDTKIWKRFEDMFIHESSLNKDWLADFYYRFLILNIGYFAKKNLYVRFSEFVTQFINEKAYGNNLKALNELIPIFIEFAEIYLSIKKEEDPDEDIKYSFNKFNKLAIDTAIPLLMYWLKLFNDDVIEKHDLLKFFNMTESFILRRSFLALRTRGYGEDFAAAISRSDSIKSLAEYFTEKGWPDDDSVKNALEKFKIYQRESKKAHLILTELEKSYGHKEEAVNDKLSIEHILPQTMTDEWITELGDNAENIHDQYLHVLGNLTLTGYNPDLSNKSSADKAEFFQSSHLEINKSIAKIIHDSGHWNGDSIMERTEIISDFVVRFWKTL